MFQVNTQSWKVMLSMLNLHIDRRRNDTVLEQLVSEMRNYTNIHHLTKKTLKFDTIFLIQKKKQ